MLVKCLALFALLACVAADQGSSAREARCGEPVVDVNINKIVDGEASKPDQWPWMGALGYRNPQAVDEPFFKCAGALISVRHVLTSAYCATMEPDLYLVRFGTLSLTNSSRVDILIDQAIVHGEYNEKTKANDIAILKLQKDVIPSNSLLPICLPFDPPLSADNYHGKLVTVAGWGMTSTGGPQSDVLKHATIPIVPIPSCRDSYSGLPNLVINDRTVCAGNKDGENNACDRDNGAPLMLKADGKFYAIGIFSYSYKCAQPGYPALFMRIAAEKEFIIRAMKQLVRDCHGQYRRNFHPESNERTSTTSKTMFKGLALIALLIIAASAQVNEDWTNILKPPDCGASKVDQVTRVMGGEQAKRGAWPWIAALGSPNDPGTTKPKWLCGGALISSRHVLTAAHCLRLVDPYVVRLGVLTLDRYEGNVNRTAEDERIDLDIELKMVHPEYNSTTRANDVAVIKLKQEVQFTEHIHPICLPAVESIINDHLTGKNVAVAGWGAKADDGGPYSDTLMQVEMPVANLSDCIDTYQILLPETVVDNSSLCAGAAEGGRDTCKVATFNFAWIAGVSGINDRLQLLFQGDSGGPLMYAMNGTYYQVGIVSFGFSCGIPTVPGVYARVTEFLDFIDTSLGK
ncbi:uncharacterized protein LOC128877550 [Hylaeus volcanicus]|uniref:uncharacterized protein LOC128877550 n=1 Tax=Hylaeus volcanicus TaxID=313075 RepID=UPI0023B813E1|nr:uncharacterized protein LOC128877550 [Hylaeus volcanicus]